MKTIIQEIFMRILSCQEYDRLMDVTHEDDGLGHWDNMFSLTSDLVVTQSPMFPLNCEVRIRGFYSARKHYRDPVSYRFVHLGFRPAFDLVYDHLPSDIEEGEAVIIGTLYMDGEPVRVPQEPVDGGDIADYIPGAKLEMRPALEDPAYQVTAILAGDVFVADRVLLKQISLLDALEALSPVKQ